MMHQLEVDPRVSPGVHEGRSTKRLYRNFSVTCDARPLEQQRTKDSSSFKLTVISSRYFVPKSSFRELFGMISVLFNILPMIQTRML